MIVTDNFSNSEESTIIYLQKSVPIFQNKVYATLEEAKLAEYGKVNLAQSNQSGFVFNSAFEPKLMNYDENYQNEQSNSEIFKLHLKSILELLFSFGIKDKKIVEIGCGKGVFFDLMLEQGLDCWGFDPTYEGNNTRIIKKYFSENFSTINAEIVIMRHTLEHIPNPFTFIHTIAKANNYQGNLFVEVPTLDWIVNKNAFWDIFYEHCNYFTQDSIACMFDNATTGECFGGQYIYLWADLSKIRSTIPNRQFRKFDALVFDESFKIFNKLLESQGSFAIWGAGAKGSTFLNLLDSNAERVAYVIDINPAKQGRFIACTGHPIYAPDILDSKPVDNIIVMNENYLSEISKALSKTNIKLYHL